MHARDTALLVGNGLLIDFARKFAPCYRCWDPQNPTRWSTELRLADSRRLMDVLPHFRRFYDRARAQDPCLTDFMIFEAITRRQRRPGPYFAWGDQLLYKKAYRDYYEDQMIEVEARHFVVGAFAAMHELLVSTTNLSTWPWYSWFKQCAPRMLAAASFNYDLLTEQTLEAVGARYQRVGLDDPEFGRVKVIKPHGSIDFYSKGIAAPIEYPLPNCISRNDCPIGRLPSLREPRLDAEIVLPGEASGISDYQWVRAGRRRWQDIAPRVRHLVIIDLSYWHCDRTELDELAFRVPRGAYVYMANPFPPAEWLAILTQRFGAGRVRAWTDGPGELA